MAELLQENEVEQLKQIIRQLQKQKISLQQSYKILLGKCKKLELYVSELEENAFYQEQLDLEGGLHSSLFQSDFQTGNYLPRPPPHFRGHVKEMKPKHNYKNPNIRTQGFKPNISGKNHQSACSDDYQTSSTTSNSPVRKENTCKACLEGVVCHFGEKKCWYVHPPKGWKVNKDKSKDCCSGKKQTRPCKCNRTDPEKDDYLYELIPTDGEEVSHE